MSEYFKAFPSSSYANTEATNILLRAKINSFVLENNVTFYPYTIVDEDRADQIAYYYYDDPTYSWLVYFSNKIVDPYYQWPLDNVSLENLLIQKYGSVLLAQNTVVGYRTNWYSDDTELNVSTHNSLPSNIKKFWEPIVSDSNRIIGYKRKKIDLSASTNKTLKATIEYTNDKTFTLNEKVSFVVSSVEVATGRIQTVGSSSLSVIHIDGNVSTSQTYDLVGDSSGSTASTVSVDSIISNFPSNEASYWTRFTAYEKEVELNESRKHIRLIDKRYKDQIYRELENLLNG